MTDAVARGADLRCGGELPDGPASSTRRLCSWADHDAPALRDGTFGPVAAVQVVPSFDAALELADRTEYGLAATVRTKGPAHAQRAARSPRSGR